MFIGVSCLSDQRYNFLKANHNFYRQEMFFPLVVYQIKDTIFWKQITTGVKPKSDAPLLFIRSKIQFFESKSQLIDQRTAIQKSCLSDQRYNFLKANHNCWTSPPHRGDGCLSDQRYNFLKANHNFSRCPSVAYHVVYQIKDTIFWKQITTQSDERHCRLALFIRSKIQFFESKSQLAILRFPHRVELFIRSKIQFFESKSQPCFTSKKERASCLSDQRYNFLKANHNLLAFVLFTK